MHLTEQPMTVQELYERLLGYGKMNLELIINKNRSTFFSLAQKRSKHFKLSLHKLFLHSPEEVCRAISHTILYNDRDAFTLIKRFGKLHLRKWDEVKAVQCEPIGKFFDLSLIYQKINKEYFDNSCALSITWSRKPRYTKKRSLTFGSYVPWSQLIRINSILDAEDVPEFFIHFVVYHEMLHYYCPVHIDTLGRERVHTALFRKREKEFSDYALAKEWEKKFLWRWFHGRT